MGWLSVTVPRSSIENGLSLIVKISPSASELAGVCKMLGDSITISENSGRLRFNC